MYFVSLCLFHLRIRVLFIVKIIQQDNEGVREIQNNILSHFLYFIFLLFVYIIFIRLFNHVIRRSNYTWKRVQYLLLFFVTFFFICSASWITLPSPPPITIPTILSYYCHYTPRHHHHHHSHLPQGTTITITITNITFSSISLHHYHHYHHCTSTNTTAPPPPPPPLPPPPRSFSTSKLLATFFPHHFFL